MHRYPGHLRVKGDDSIDFEHRPDYFALRQSSKEGTTGAVAVMPDDADTHFAVFEGTPRRGTEVGPVYSVGPDGPLAVPTGRVFVRLDPELRPEERKKQFAAAGFEIERTLSYAPNAAWLRPTRGGVAAALPALAELEKLPGVVHVEPQMLLERALKKG